MTFSAQISSTVARTSMGDIEYAEVGNGPAALVSHGTGGGYDRGLFIASSLATGDLRFLAVSRPGYLGTPLSVGKTPEQQADAFAALLDSLNLAGAAFIGVSGGAPSVLQFALRHPKRCWALVLISGVTQALPEWKPSLGDRLSRRLTENQAIAAASNRILQVFQPSASPESRQRSWNPAVRFLEKLASYKARRDGRDNDYQQLASLSDYDLSRVACPALIVHGTDDDEVPFRQAEFAARTIPDAELLSVPGAGHGMLFRHPERVSISIVDFLNAHAGSTISGH